MDRNSTCFHVTSLCLIILGRGDDSRGNVPHAIGFGTATTRSYGSHRVLFGVHSRYGPCNSRGRWFAFVTMDWMVTGWCKVRERGGGGKGKQREGWDEREMERWVTCWAEERRDVRQWAGWAGCISLHCVTQLDITSLFSDHIHVYWSPSIYPQAPSEVWMCLTPLSSCSPYRCHTALANSVALRKSKFLSCIVCNNESNWFDFRLVGTYILHHQDIHHLLFFFLMWQFCVPPLLNTFSITCISDSISPWKSTGHFWEICVALCPTHCCLVTMELSSHHYSKQDSGHFGELFSAAVPQWQQ